MPILTVTPTDLGEVVVTGNNYQINATLQKNGATYNVTGATITASLRPSGSRNNVLLNHAVTIVTAATGIVRLTLTGTETGGLLWNEYAPNYLQQHIYYVDFKVVESGGDTLNSAPLKIPVRRALT